MLILTQAINNLKASAAAVSRANTVQSGPSRELPKPKTDHQDELHNLKPEPSMGPPKSRSSSVLPSDFFDTHDAKRQKNGIVLFPDSIFCWVS